MPLKIGSDTVAALMFGSASAALMLGATAVSAPVEFIEPQISRMAVSDAVFAKGDGDPTTTAATTAITQLINNANVATIGTSVPSDNVANSVTTFAYQTAGDITGKGAFLWLLGSSGAMIDSVMQSFVIDLLPVSLTREQVLVAETGEVVSFAPVKPAGESSTATMLTRGQLVSIPAHERCWVRVRFTKDNSATVRTPRAALYQRPAEGTPDDVVLLAGPSLMSPHAVLDMRTSLRTINTTRDPIVLNMGRAGAVASDVVTETVQGGLAAYPDAATLVLDIGGNDITNNRPYSVDQTHLPNALADVLTVLAGYPACMPFLQGITWRNYPEPNAVNDLTNPENGSKLYNDNQIYPWIRTNEPWCWDDELGIPRLDQYSTIMYAGPTAMNSDGIHLLTAGNVEYRLSGFVEAYLRRTGDDWTRPGFVERTIATAEAGTITAANKARLQACIDQWPSVENSNQTVARNALVARLNAIPVV